jgi:hypothetical protein
LRLDLCDKIRLCDKKQPNPVLFSDKAIDCRLNGSTIKSSLLARVGRLELIVIFLTYSGESVATALKCCNHSRYCEVMAENNCNTKEDHPINAESWQPILLRTLIDELTAAVDPASYALGRRGWRLLTVLSQCPWKNNEGITMRAESVMCIYRSLQIMPISEI